MGFFHKLFGKTNETGNAGGNVSLSPEQFLAADNWSPHHIMIGDLGNIYFYVCKSCGETSIESYWDCY